MHSVSKHMRLLTVSSQG